MGENRVVHSGGIGLGGLLTIIFVIMKCTGTITWSWWWVFAPLWIPFVFVLGLLAFVGIITACAFIFNI